MPSISKGAKPTLPPEAELEVVVVVLEATEEVMTVVVKVVVDVDGVDIVLAG